MIKLCEPDITNLERKFVNQALLEKEISGESAYVRLFEERFAEYVGTKHAIAVSSGFSALLLACWLFVKDKKVLLPDITMIASANAVKLAGGQVVLGDVDEHGLIQYKTEYQADLAMPVHLYGRKAEIAFSKSNIAIVDSAEYLWPNMCKEYDERVVTCFSFYANKIITTGEGGMITTNDDDLAAELRKLRAHYFGEERFFHPKLGFNFRMTAMQAALGLAQLHRATELIAKRRHVAKYYHEQLKEVLECPEIEAKDSCWFYVVHTPRRDELVAYLSKAGIETRKYFIPLHQQPEFLSDEGFPMAQHLADTGLLLPFTNKTDELKFICGKIKEFFNIK